MVSSDSSTICIVGGGPAGMAAAMALSHEDVHFDLIEARPQLGGLWNLRDSQSLAYQGLSCVTSREMTCFIDRPFDTGTPLFPRAVDIERYLSSVSVAIGLDKKAHFGRKITTIQLDRSNRNRVALRFDDGESKVYAGVVIAVGMQRPNVRIYRSADAYGLHSSRYRHERDRMVGSRVAVIGGGNSAAGIAQDLINFAGTVTVVLPEEGRWFVPKHIRGIPADLASDSDPCGARQFQRDLRGILMDDLIGPLEQYGLRTPRHLPITYPSIIGTGLLSAYLDGKVDIAYGLRSVSASEVVVGAGQRIAADYVVFATGYPELLDELGILSGSYWERMYMRTIHSNYPNVCLLGDVPSDIGGFWLIELLARVVARHFKLQLSMGWSPLDGAASVDLSGGGVFASRGMKTPFMYGSRLLDEIRSCYTRLDLPYPLYLSEGHW